MPTTQKPEGQEGTGLELGECSCDTIDHLFSFGHVFEKMVFTAVAMHSHLCPCGYKWWHSRQQVDQSHDKHAHECPNCGTEVTQVHGWEDPKDEDPKHHEHHNHFITSAKAA